MNSRFLNLSIQLYTQIDTAVYMYMCVMFVCICMYVCIFFCL